VVAWVFGRELSDGTVRYLLALPTSRGAIVAAKLVVVSVWCAALTALITVLGLAVGAVLSLPEWSAEAAWQGIAHIWAGGGVTAISFAILAVTGAAGTAGTFAWWLYADFSR